MRWIETVAAPALRGAAAWLQSMHGRLDEPMRAAILAGMQTRRDGPIVAIEGKAIDTAWKYVSASALERGGLLVGEPLAAGDDDPRPAVVYVRAAVPGLDDEATGHSLRMQSGVWDAARQALQPGEVVVGWFHSHPGIGAFFSATDRRTQAGFFHHPFSLGWVIDPQRREHAWFAGASADPIAPAAIVQLAGSGDRSDAR
jgi:proteasome lid subunit RPN8/RPN11